VSPAWAEKPAPLPQDATASATASPNPLGAMLERLRQMAAPTAAPVPAPPPPASAAGGDRAINGTPFTGELSELAPSQRLAGREAALRFRFQQQIQTGDVPWAQRSWRD
jgi:hypothetical protein